MSDSKPGVEQFGITEKDLTGVHPFLRQPRFRKPDASIVGMFSLLGGVWLGVYLAHKLIQELHIHSYFLQFLLILCISFGTGLLLVKVAIILIKPETEPIKPTINPVYTKVSQYKSALRLWELKEKTLAEKPWRDMDGWQFEKAIADLYIKQGYSTAVTPGSGDHGVDIHLKLNDQRFIVQCKQQIKAVSPHIVRDLFGTMHSERASGAILVCTGGFSRETVKWSADKPIQLIDMNGILKMEKESLIKPDQHQDGVFLKSVIK